MLKYLFTLTLILFVISCNQNPKVEKKPVLPKIDSSDAFTLSDTIANVEELIVYNRTPQSNLEILPPFLKIHIPKGYSPLDTVSADINSDGIRDFILASYKIGEDSINPSPKRNLKILLGRNDTTYKYECESWEALAPLDMGGMSDPYPGIIAEKGKFVIQFSGGSNWKGTSSTTFEYSETDKDWIQTKEITESYFMDKRHYESDTLTSKQFGRLTFKKNYCKKLK